VWGRGEPFLELVEYWVLERGVGAGNYSLLVCVGVWCVGCVVYTNNVNNPNNSNNLKP
jgi:hypothetical protein